MADNFLVNDGRVVTLGMFIVDRFLRLDSGGREIESNRAEQLGGAGTYFSVAARIFLRPPQIGQIVNYNPTETSAAILDKLQAYNVTAPASNLAGRVEDDTSMWHFKETEHTSLIMNTYEGERRVEKFLARSPQIWPNDIVHSPLLGPLPSPASAPPSSSPQPTSTSFPQFLHFCTSPIRARTILEQLSHIRINGLPSPAPTDHDNVRGKGWSPGLIWEIYPPDSIPENMEIVKRITRNLLTSSPNHVEALGLFGVVPEERKGQERVLVQQVERVVREMVGWLYEDPGPPDDRKSREVDSLDVAKHEEPWRRSARSIIVRCGALGACIGQISDPASNVWTDIEDVKITWVEAYWTTEAHPDAAERIKDVTGGGNAFEGGLAAGLKLSAGDAVEASLYASVASSFIIEQDGLPTLSHHVLPNGTIQERWNGEDPLVRLKEMRGRLRLSGGRPVLST